MTQSPLWLVLTFIFAVPAAFFVAFALKVAALQWWYGQGIPRRTRASSGGFEVKLAGAKPVLKEKENDHG
jgi:hypothetical protein